ncbi:uncharacterized protein B0H18DRAFT_976980, partial [Fomitopsis serialis]|uniref:uncharacterized protein n=1 Tax=Fomitopsis serialis TaxID=139415 RepID=UPI002008C7D0
MSCATHCDMYSIVLRSLNGTNSPKIEMRVFGSVQDILKVSGSADVLERAVFLSADQARTRQL